MTRSLRTTPVRSAGCFACGFSLIELLVVMGILGLLLSLLLPGLSAARARAQSIVCASNIRQLTLANELYAQAHQGRYCPGMAERRKNLHRWHGTRRKINEPFDLTDGPLTPFLGSAAAIRACPSFPADDITRHSGGFEAGAGGFGYNNRYLGVELRFFASGEGIVLDDRVGAMRDRVAQPSKTAMFTDTAFAAGVLIEYSFAEPRFHVERPASRADPSIHFRHATRANVAWCDGHVDTQAMTLSWSSGLYAADPRRWNLGWFGEADDNRYFDLN